MVLAQQSLKYNRTVFKEHDLFLPQLVYKDYSSNQIRCVVFDFNVGKAEKPSLMAQFLNRGYRNS